MSNTITVSAKTLRRMLAGVLPHAGRDDTLPVLNTVKIEVRSGVLYLAATDRFSIGVARQRIPGYLAAAGPDLDALVCVDDAEKLSALVLGDDRPAPLLTADLGEAGGTWQTMALDQPEWPSATHPWQSVLYPLFGAEPANLDGDFGMELRLLARFAAIDAGPYMPYCDDEDEPDPEWPAEGARMRVICPDGPMVLVTRGEWFIGAAMACRMRGPRSAPPAWDDWAEALKPAAQDDETPQEKE